MKTNIIIALLIMALALQCDDGPTAEQRNTMVLENIGNIMTGYYKALNENTAKLQTSFATYKSSKTKSNLNAMRTVWKRAFLSWVKASVFNIGPVARSNRHVQLASWAKAFYLCTKSGDRSRLITNPGLCSNTIESLISASATSLNGNNRLQGFEAVEYLLYDNGSGSSSLSDLLVVLNGSRLTYLELLITHLKGITQVVYDEWRPDSGNWVAQLTKAGSGSTEYTTQILALSEIHIQLIDYYSAIRDARVGAAGGFTIKYLGAPNTERIESRFSNESFAGLEAAIEAFEDIYIGAGKPGFADLVNRENPEVNTRMLTELATSKKRIASIKKTYGTIRQALTSNANAIEQLFILMRPIKVLMTTDVINAAGTNPGVSGADGD